MDKNNILQRYLDGELTSREEKEALHLIAEDEELRSLLRFEHQLSEAFVHGPVTYPADAVPEGFSDRVMHQIEQREYTTAREGVIERLKGWFEQLWIPQPVQWRPAYSFVMAILVIVSLGYPLFFMSSQVNQSSQIANLENNMERSVEQVSAEGAEEVMLRFIYMDEDASSIAVAGDFSNWEPIELTSQNVNGEKVWTGLISVSRGEHHYMFIRDGKQWVTDPLAPVQRDDGFGNKNAVIYL